MTIGILGGGQLGYMLALAGYPLGLHFRFLDPSPEAPVGRIATRITAQFGDRSALKKFAAGLELVTYEFENVPVETARFLAEHVPVLPPPAALEAAQDRLNEKHLFQKLGIATTEFVAVANREALDSAVKQIGLPAILKTCRMGYDGKGQWILRNAEDVARLESEFPAAGVAAAERSRGNASAEPVAPFLLEQLVPFARELSVLAVRGRTGETAVYPLVENHHRGGILRLSLAPAPNLDRGVQHAAEDAARRVCDELRYVGVLAIEFFEHEGRLLANEMAPRVHNSGHWTIEGAITSQFENHLRAVVGLPLGSTSAIGSSAMLNLIGDVPDSAEVLAVRDTHLHLYGKSARAGRKLGHVTLRASSPEQLATRLGELPGYFHRPEFGLDAVLRHSASARR
ncbi:MAG TPA: 5-(carboxyamino)imidazole ribonucleotide synthase [Candidatus Saccharimonadales bacterium]|nr:5-(carboxyamino)imidazole ribonucleotide synthase [Candidatus Saccharimonadales bacterium]